MTAVENAAVDDDANDVVWLLRTIGLPVDTLGVPLHNILGVQIMFEPGLPRTVHVRTPLGMRRYKSRDRAWVETTDHNREES
jgi:hypothetical protein